MAKKTNDKMIDDGLSKTERRNRNLKLKADAKQRAFNEKLNWFDDIPAAQFHQNFDEAFKIATTHIKAVELMVDPSAPTTTAPVTETVEEGRVGERILAKANDTPAIAEAIKHFNAQVAEGAENVEPLAEGKIIVANDNTETKADELATATATGEPTEQAEPVEQTEDKPNAVVENPEDQTTETPAVEQNKTQPDTESSAPIKLTNEFDEAGKLIRWPGESSKLYGRRAHKAKLAKAWTKPEAVEETRNGEPPTTEKSYPEGDLEYHSDHDGQSVQPPAKKPIEAPVELPEAIVDPMLKRADEPKKAWKARIKLLNEVKAELPEETAEPTKSALDSANVFEAAEMSEQTTATTVPDATDTGTEEAPATEAPVVDTPAEEAPNNAPEEVQEPVQTEPVSKPVEQGPSEAKTDKKPTLTLVPKTEFAATYEQPAKKFYGAAWSNERAAKLTEAYRFLEMAIRAEKDDKASTVGMAMKQALRFEAEAFAEAMSMAA